MAKSYSNPENYEAKLERVMNRLGVDEYDFDWSRHGGWVTFKYKGHAYHFEHSIENAKQRGVELKYGSDAFAQLVLSLEDLARMVERGIYDLSVWVAGMKYLPEAKTVEPCFAALGFTKRPENMDALTRQYKQMAKALHPDAGGDAEASRMLCENYERCKELMSENGDAPG